MIKDVLPYVQLYDESGNYHQTVFWVLWMSKPQITVSNVPSFIMVFIMIIGPIILPNMILKYMITANRQLHFPNPMNRCPKKRRKFIMWNWLINPEILINTIKTAKKYRSANVFPIYKTVISIIVIEKAWNNLKKTLIYYR